MILAQKAFRLWAILVVLGGTASVSALAQEASGSTQAVLTVDRVFASPSILGPRAIGAQLSPDGAMLTYLKPKAENAGVQDLWAVATSGGEPFILVDANALSTATKTLSEAEKARRERMRVSSRGVVAYAWAENSQSLLVPLDGDIYRVDRQGRAVTQLTNTQADEVDAKLSPNGQWLSYVRDYTLFVQDIVSGQETQITPSSTQTVTYATAEFIAQEELDRHTGYWWSPKGDAIAYQSTDESLVPVAERVEVGADTIELVKQRYPYAGKANATVTLYIKTLGKNDVVKIDLGATDDFYLARVHWANDGKNLYVQRLSRDQKVLDLLKVDVATGKSQTLLRETSDSWVELHDDFRLLKDGGFIWSSERDGNKHLYLYAADGKLVRQITKGDWPVHHLSDVNEAKGLIYFEAAKDTPIEHHLYSVAFKKTSEPFQITSKGGWWNTTVSGHGSVFIGTYSDPATPLNTALYDINSKRLRWIEANSLDEKHPYHGYKDRYLAPEFGTLKAVDGQQLQWSMYKPVNFDPSKTYPVIVSIYGGPARAMVTRSWSDPAVRLFQEAGYIVFTLDNRGTPGRSVAFTRAIYKQFGGPDIDDQIMGARWLQTLPFVDSKHIGIMGWSQGGFVTLMALTAKDTPFVAGAAGAPPTDWRLYDTAYTERYMSTPELNPDGYAASDVVARLDNLKPGSLLLMHGMADDNVQLSNTTRVMTALQKKGIAFELMLYPGERHGIRGAEKNTQRYRLYLDFFDRKLKPQIGL